MTSQSSGNPLPAHRAFVVHFAAGRRFTGRVEHLTSGAWIHFASLRALLAFFAARRDAAPSKSEETP